MSTQDKDDTSIWVADSNEPEAMRRYALAQGVPNEDIVLDDAGRRTGRSARATCYLAGDTSGVAAAVLVTQHFRLDRTVYTCDQSGVDADRRSPQGGRRECCSIRFWWWRELVVVTRAWLDLNLLHPTPVLGEREPIL